MLRRTGDDNPYVGGPGSNRSGRSSSGGSRNGFSLWETVFGDPANPGRNNTAGRTYRPSASTTRSYGDEHRSQRNGPSSRTLTNRPPIGNVPTSGPSVLGTGNAFVPSTTRYFEGDEWLPANWDAGKIRDIQRKLAKAGLLQGKFNLGIWDENTRAAYSQLLEYSNMTNQDYEHSLSSMLNTANANGGVGYTVDPSGNIVPANARPPLIARTTDPNILDNVFREAVINLTGEGWSKDKILRMVKAYNDTEIQRQREQYMAEAMSENYTAGEQHIVDIPSPEAFAQNYAEEQDPEGVQEAKFLDFTNEFMQLAGSTAWGVG